MLPVAAIAGPLGRRAAGGMLAAAPAAAGIAGGAWLAHRVTERVMTPSSPVPSGTHAEADIRRAFAWGPAVIGGGITIGAAREAARAVGAWGVGTRAMRGVGVGAMLGAAYATGLATVPLRRGRDLAGDALGAAAERAVPEAARDAAGVVGDVASTAGSAAGAAGDALGKERVLRRTVIDERTSLPPGAELDIERDLLRPPRLERELAQARR
jgi:hypothetical protein